MPSPLGSPDTRVPEPDKRKPLDYYYELKKDNEAQAYLEWIEDWLDITLTGPQEEMVHAVVNNQKTLIVGANGFGKTYFLVAFSLAFFYLNIESVVVATSGTYQKMKRSYLKPIRELHEQTWGLPGQFLVSSSMIRIDEYPNMYLTATAPSDPGELEGVHSDHLLGIIEEADKSGINENHFDSMESLIVDRRDKLIVSANPPKTESDITNKIMQDETWETVRFSSFDAYNVQLEMNHEDPYQTDEDGEVKTENGWPLLKPSVEDQMVDGVVRLRQIYYDWKSWNEESWPGIEEAMNSGERDDLNVQWYRRRLGEKPPELATVHRPYIIDDVEDAFDRDPPTVSATPQALALDVARTGGDLNVLVGVFEDDIRVIDYWQLSSGETHMDSESKVRDAIEGHWDCEFCIDAVGEGSALADMIHDWYPNVYRFNNGSNAVQSEKYANKWTEANAELGKKLQDRGSISNRKLREHLRAGARSLQYSTSFTKSRGHDFLRLNPKEDVEDRLGQSPDFLDAAAMACWSASEDTETGPTEISSTW